MWGKAGSSVRDMSRSKDERETGRTLEGRVLVCLVTIPVHGARGRPHKVR